MKRALEEAEATCASWRKVAHPDKPMHEGNFNAAMRFMVMKLIGMANVPHTNVPLVIDITSQYFGVKLPGRWRKVLVSAARGVRTYEPKWLLWRPCPGTCENIR